MVLAALVHSGDIVLSLAGKKIDAAGIDQFAKIGIGEVTEFKHIDRPRDLPLGPLQDSATFSTCRRGSWRQLGH